MVKYDDERKLFFEWLDANKAKSMGVTADK